MLGDDMLSLVKPSIINYYAECHYAERRFCKVPYFIMLCKQRVFMLGFIRLYVFMLDVVMLRGVFNYAECLYAGCRNAEYRYARCHYADCHYAECHYVELHHAKHRYSLC